MEQPKAPASYARSANPATGCLTDQRPGGHDAGDNVARRLTAAAELCDKALYASIIMRGLYNNEREFVTIHRRPRLAAVALILTGLCVTACGDEREEEVPPMLRVRFETEMKTILRDVRSAQAMAAATEGRYLELDALRARYLSRAIPDSYELSMTGVSETGFTAEIVHNASDLRCSLEVGGGGTGVPSCD